MNYEWIIEDSNAWGQHIDVVKQKENRTVLQYAKFLFE